MNIHRQNEQDMFFSNQVYNKVHLNKVSFMPLYKWQVLAQHTQTLTHRCSNASPDIFDVEPTIKQHWVNGSCLLG